MGLEIVTKLNAAKRQLNEAIRLFFDRRDSVSIHTLTVASEQILSDICNARGIKGRFRYNSDIIREEARSRWIAHLKEAQNFFKHADRDSDPKGTLKFNADQTIWIMFEAILMYGRFTNESTHEAKVFLFWFSLTEPDLLNDCLYKQSVEACRDFLDIDTSDFAFFANLIMEEENITSAGNGNPPVFRIRTNKHD